MSKRAADAADDAALKAGSRPQTAGDDTNEAGNFEDDYEDEFEDEILEAGGDEDEDADNDAKEDAMEVDNQTFIPGRHKLDPGQVLAPDLSTYDLLHTLSATWPCLSFDVLRDGLGSGRARRKYPATVYSVAGTQAARGRDAENEIMVMKMSKLAKMDKPDEDDSEDDDSDDDDTATDPVLETKSIRTGTVINRIRAWQAPEASTTPGQMPTTLTAAMTEKGDVLIHDVTPHLRAFDTPGASIPPNASTPKTTISTHGRVEGFALDWSTTYSASSGGPPRLVTGDTAGRVFVHTCAADGRVASDSRPFAASDGASCEELQWSPSEAHVFASAHAGGTVRIWDARSKSRKPALEVAASKSDVNVLSWSRATSYLLASGADDGSWGVWDLRSWKPSGNSAPAKPPAPVASFDFHSEQVTSVEWHPTDDSVVAVAAGDSTVSLWDVAVEHDDEESRYTADARDVPPQLLFVHYFEDVKEAHWHPQQDGLLMATGGSGFGVFKTISI